MLEPLWVLELLSLLLVVFAPRPVLSKAERRPPRQGRCVSCGFLLFVPLVLPWVLELFWPPRPNCPAFGQGIICGLLEYKTVSPELFCVPFEFWSSPPVCVPGPGPGCGAPEAGAAAVRLPAHWRLTDDPVSATLVRFMSRRSMPKVLSSWGKGDEPREPLRDLDLEALGWLRKEAPKDRLGWG